MSRTIGAVDGASYLVRAARGDDAEAVLALRRAVGAEGRWLATEVPRESLDQQRSALERLADPGRGVALVAVEGERVLGLLVLERDAQESSRHVAELGVLVAARDRGRGIGAALVDEGLAWAPVHGLRKITLGVFPENLRAIRLYERFGFVREGLRRAQLRMSSGFRDELLMARFLE